MTRLVAVLKAQYTRRQARRQCFSSINHWQCHSDHGPDSDSDVESQSPANFGPKTQIRVESCNRQWSWRRAAAAGPAAGPALKEARGGQKLSPPAHGPVGPACRSPNALRLGVARRDCVTEARWNGRFQAKFQLGR